MPDIKVVIAISISFLGVYIISLSRNKGSAVTDWRQKANSVTLGLLAGLALGGCSVFFRIAMDYLPFLDVLHRAVLTSFLAVAIQALIMGAALLIWRKGEFFACLASWRVSLFAGTVAAITTFMWFVAFSLIGVAPVRMLGQVEIIFSMAFSFVMIFSRKFANVFNVRRDSRRMFSSFLGAKNERIRLPRENQNRKR